MSCNILGFQHYSTVKLLSIFSKLESLVGWHLPLGEESTEIFIFQLAPFIESACSAGDIVDSSLIPRLGRSTRGGNDNPLQYSCLKNSVVRGAWQAMVHGVAKSQTLCRLFSKWRRIEEIARKISADQYYCKMALSSLSLIVLKIDNLLCHFHEYITESFH